MPEAGAMARFLGGTARPAPAPGVTGLTGLLELLAPGDR